MDINYEYYKIFYYVAKYKNISKASKIMMMNQPNVSRTIKILEERLDTSLFIRHSYGLELTTDGEFLYNHIKTAVSEIDEAEKHLSGEREIRIGTTEIALKCYLLDALRRIKISHPNLKVILYNYASHEAYDAIKKGQVDIIFLTYEYNDLNMKKIKEINEIAIAGNSYSNLKDRELSFYELSKMPLITLPENTKTYEFYSELFLKHDSIYKPDIEVAASDQIIPMVKNNLGIGFIPEIFLDKEKDDVMVLKLKDEIPKRFIYAAINNSQRSYKNKIIDELLP